MGMMQKLKKFAVKDNMVSMAIGIAVGIILWKLFN